MNFISHHHEPGSLLYSSKPPMLRALVPSARSTLLSGIVHAPHRSQTSSESTYTVSLLRTSIPNLQPLLLRQLVLTLPCLHLLVIDTLLIDREVGIRVDLGLDPLVRHLSASTISKLDVLIIHTFIVIRSKDGLHVSVCSRICIQWLRCACASGENGLLPVVAAEELRLG